MSDGHAYIHAKFQNFTMIAHEEFVYTHIHTQTKYTLFYVDNLIFRVLLLKIFKMSLPGVGGPCYRSAPFFVKSFFLGSGDYVFFVKMKLTV